MLKIRQFNSQKCYNKSPFQSQIEILAHLNDPVLRWPSALSLKHGVDVCRHGHGNRLHTLLCHVPLFGVLVNLVMVKTSERHVGAQDHLGTVFLRKQKLRLLLLVRAIIL